MQLLLNNGVHFSGCYTEFEHLCIQQGLNLVLKVIVASSGVIDHSMVCDVLLVVVLVHLFR